MYSGEVNVYEHQLASMLSMADTLHIKGLAEFSNVGILLFIYIDICIKRLSLMII